MRILLVDDHSLFRAGIRYLLLQLVEDGQALQIDEAGDRASLMACLEKHDEFDLVLLDLHMPDIHGLAALETMRQRYPQLPVVVLSASDDRAEMQRSLELGALGFIPKSSSPAVLLNALRLILAGGMYVPPVMVQGTAIYPSLASNFTARPTGLTPRQSAVLSLVLEGNSNKVIAAKLGLSEATVKAHVTAVFRTLGVANRMQAAIVAGKLASES
jgi:DNA-binding NarL/FixJ family response regulator